MAYQMTFAVITCALVGGAVADRHEIFGLSRCSARCGCSSSMSRARTGCGAAASWRALGVIDFAGGTVVHINAGVAGLVAALMVGARQGYGRENLAPFDLSLAVDRRRPAVGRLVRLQRRLGARRRIARRLRHRRDASLRLRRRAGLERARMDGARQALGARPDLRRRRRPRHDHARLGLRPALAGRRHRRAGRRRLLLGRAPRSSSGSATTIRSTCSACTASAACSARCSPACSPPPR